MNGVTKRRDKLQNWIQANITVPYKLTRLFGLKDGPREGKGTIILENVHCVTHS
jgi:hypothetical protein